MNAASSRWRTICGNASAMLALSTRQTNATASRHKYGRILGSNLPSGRGDDTGSVARGVGRCAETANGGGEVTPGKPYGRSPSRGREARGKAARTYRPATQAWSIRGSP